MVTVSSYKSVGLKNNSSLFGKNTTVQKANSLWFLCPCESTSVDSEAHQFETSSFVIVVLFYDALIALSTQPRSCLVYVSVHQLAFHPIVWLWPSDHWLKIMKKM